MRQSKLSREWWEMILGSHRILKAIVGLWLLPREKLLEDLEHKVNMN